MFIIKALLVFALTTGISFLGSLQAGLVNVAVIRTALTRGRKAALWLALGGSLPEMLYAGLAAVAGDFINQYAWLGRYMDYGVIAVFLAMGVSMILQKPKPVSVNPESDATARRAFWKGLALGLINPQLFPFWLGVYVYANRTLFPLQNLLFQLSFMSGAAFGAWLLLSVLARYLAAYQSVILNWLGNRLSLQVLGWLFIVLAVWKIIFILL